MKERIWVNFKELRVRLSFEAVLRHFNVEIKRRGNQHQSSCPLPGHMGSKSASSFSANLDRGIFQCFGCGAKGNVLEFAAMMRGVDLGDGDAFRAVALELQKKCFSEGTSSRQKSVTPKAIPGSKPTVLNAPLDFELKGLDGCHPYLRNRGFTPETVHHFGIGVCSRGLLKGRLAVPLHDHEGKVLGYAGRVVDDSLITDDNPRYVFPTTRERDGKVYEFREGLFLYNGFRIKIPCEDLIVVQGFASVWWLTQCGFPWTVALMGYDCSEEQSETIANLVRPKGRVWLMVNGDEAGERLAVALIPRLSLNRFVRWVKLEKGFKPTALSAADLKRRFSA